MGKSNMIKKKVINDPSEKNENTYTLYPIEIEIEYLYPTQGLPRGDFLGAV